MNCFYNIVMKHLCNLQSDHPEKLSTRKAPYIVIRILLTIFPMLYFTCPWLFCDYQFVLHNPFSFCTHPHALPICKPSKRSLYLEVIAGLLVHFFVFQIPHNSETVWSGSQASGRGLALHHGLSWVSGLQMAVCGTSQPPELCEAVLHTEALFM